MSGFGLCTGAIALAAFVPTALAQQPNCTKRSDFVYHLAQTYDEKIHCDRTRRQRQLNPGPNFEIRQDLDYHQNNARRKCVQSCGRQILGLRVAAQGCRFTFEVVKPDASPTIVTISVG